MTTPAEKAERPAPEAEPEPPEPNTYTAANEILTRYYRELVTKAAEQIVDKDEEFTADYYTTAQEILDAYAQRIHNLVIVNQHILKFAPKSQESGQPCKVKEIMAIEETLGDEINRWLEREPTAVPYSMCTLQGEEGLRCLILYRDNARKS